MRATQITTQAPLSDLVASTSRKSVQPLNSHRMSRILLRHVDLPKPVKCTDPTAPRTKRNAPMPLLVVLPLAVAGTSSTWLGEKRKPWHQRRQRHGECPARPWINSSKLWVVVFITKKRHKSQVQTDLHSHQHNRGIQKKEEHCMSIIQCICIIDKANLSIINR